MPRHQGIPFDEIGVWSEVKLEIIRKYASAYSTIFGSDKQARFSHVYIDAFSGSGIHIAKERGELVAGSPLNALWVKPPFQEYHFIDLDGDKIAALKALAGDREDVHIYHGDCNEILVKEVFPRVKYEDYRRGLCLLDPYGLDLDWAVIEAAGRSGTIDMFLNFPIMDMNRNALWRNPDAVGQHGIARMNAFWGDDSWRKTAYRQRQTLFGEIDEKADNQAVVDGFRKRLHDVADFKYVAEPLPMRNSTNAVVYYLFFASQKESAKNIIADILAHYRGSQKE